MWDIPDRLGNMVTGYQDLFDDFNRLNTTGIQSATGYPPYNMIHYKNGKDFRIEIAVAGFKDDDIEITKDNRSLIIKGDQKVIDEEDIVIEHRGIAARNFRREFMMAPNVKVGDVTLQDGILIINLHKEIPEELQPKRIPISSK